jgi:hypothetical protein
MVVTDGGKSRRIDVPVEVPEGVKGMADADVTPVNGRLFAYSVNAARATASRSGVGFGVVSNKKDSLRRTPAPPPNSAPMVSSVQASVGAVPAERTELVEQTTELQQKLHRSVLAAVQKVQKNDMVFSTTEFGFIRDGKAELQVWLTEKSDEAYAQLKELGFEVVLDAKGSKVIIGRLPVEKLEALAKLKAVKYVAPQK